MRKLTTLLGILLVVVGCDVTFMPASPSPLIKPTAGPINLRTVGTSPSPSPCPGSDIEGTLIEAPDTGLGLLDDSGSVRLPVVWPHGYSASPSVGGSNLYDASGDLVARTGELVRIEATQPVPGGPWVVCGGVIRIPFDG